MRRFAFAPAPKLGDTKSTSKWDNWREKKERWRSTWNHWWRSAWCLLLLHIMIRTGLKPKKWNSFSFLCTVLWMDWYGRFPISVIAVRAFPGAIQFIIAQKKRRESEIVGGVDRSTSGRGVCFVQQQWGKEQVRLIITSLLAVLTESSTSTWPNYPPLVFSSGRNERSLRGTTANCQGFYPCLVRGVVHCLWELIRGVLSILKPSQAVKQSRNF